METEARCVDNVSSPTIAVLGTGSIGLRHLETFRALNIQTIAIPIRPERKSELLQLGFSVQSNLQEAHNQGASLAVIATNTSQHIQDSLAALSLGMSVLIEKPLAPTLSDCQELLRFLSDSTNTVSQQKPAVYLGYTLRFHAGLFAFKTLLPRVGTIHDVRIECQSYLPSWRPGRDYRTTYAASLSEGGVLRDLVHEIDYALWLFGRPTHVWARLRQSRTLEIQSEDSATLVWEAKTALVSIHLDYLAPIPRRCVRATGSEGTLSLNLLDHSVQLLSKTAETYTETVTQNRDAMMQQQAKAFLEGCAGSQVPRLGTLNDGLLALAVCDAARESSRSRKEEALKQDIDIKE